MANFIENIDSIINSEVELKDKISTIKEQLSHINVEQLEPIRENSEFIPAKVTYKGQIVEGAGICAKDAGGWSFKPSLTKENGIANVKIVKQGDKTTKETFFIITQLWKKPFFSDNGIEVPYLKVTLH